MRPDVEHNSSVLSSSHLGASIESAFREYEKQHFLISFDPARSEVKNRVRSHERWEESGREMSEEWEKRRRKVTIFARIASILFLGIIAIAIIAGSVVIIPAGNRGVVLTWGQVTEVKSEGLSFIVPIMQRIELMDVTIQKAEAKESVASEDLQEVTATIAVNYRLNPGYVDEIYKNFRQEYENRIVIPNIQESIKATTALFKAEELITKRSELKIKFEEVLKQRLAVFHIDVISVAITNLEFSPQFTAAIEAKVTAEQRALEAKNKLEQVRYEAQQQIIQAQAYYNATILKAMADAEALRLRRQSLDPLILQWIALEKWDGRLPYFLGGGAIPFLYIPVNATAPQG